MRWRRRARSASAGPRASTGTSRSSNETRTSRPQLVPGARGVTKRELVVPGWTADSGELAFRDRHDRPLAAAGAAAGRAGARPAVGVVPALDVAAAGGGAVRRLREAAPSWIHGAHGVARLAVVDRAVVVHQHDRAAGADDAVLRAARAGHLDHQAEDDE